MIAASGSAEVALAGDFAPASGDGIAVRVNVESGSGGLASSGEGAIFTDPDGAGFALLAVSANLENDYGDYTWTKTGANTGDLTLDNEVSGLTVTYSVTFQTPDAGTFSADAPNIGTQTGTFDFHHILKPSAVSEALAAGQPVARVDEGAVEVEFQVKRSDYLNTWTDESGSVSSDGSGQISFTTPVDSNAEFLRVDVLGTP